jgi:toxin-antitoxin system PIN domain toxin
MFVVDTNILLYGAVRQFADHEAARRLIEEWTDDVTPWHSTWSIFYEFMRVSTHAAVFKRPLRPDQAWQFLSHLLLSPGFSLLPESSEHGAFVTKLVSLRKPVQGNLWHDAHTVALMMEHGVLEIRTADTDFHRFEGIRVVNPLKNQ